jgi:hypothetical protein
MVCLNWNEEVSPESFKDKGAANSKSATLLQLHERLNETINNGQQEVLEPKTALNYNSEFRQK